MDDSTFWVVERYVNNDLLYWSVGARGKSSRDDWSPGIDNATKFFDGASAIRVLIHACGGEGRTASHKFIAT